MEVPSIVSCLVGWYKRWNCLFCKVT
jgi:hypothetical protein